MPIFGAIWLINKKAYVEIIGPTEISKYNFSSNNTNTYIYIYIFMYLYIYIYIYIYIYPSFYVSKVPNKEIKKKRILLLDSSFVQTCCNCLPKQRNAVENVQYYFVIFIVHMHL